MIQNIVVTKLGSEADNSTTRTLFSSSTLWETNGENLVVYKNGALILKDTDYTVVSTSQIKLIKAVSATDSITMIITSFTDDTNLNATSLDRAVKKIEGKAQTSVDKNIWEESISSNFIIHSDDVWASTIDELPNNAVSTGIAMPYTKLSLVQDTTVSNKKGWYASSNGTLSGRLKNWIPPKFGQGYIVRLYDSTGTEIPSSASINWKWDYSAGYLFIENDHTYSTPFYITGYVYAGEYIGDSDGSGSFWKPPVATESNLPVDGNVNGDVRLVLDSNIPYRWDATNTKWVQTIFGSASFRDPVYTFSALPYTNNANGDFRLVLDTNSIYRWNSTTGSWVDVLNSHNHDTLYYTKDEIDSSLAGKSNKNHNHNTLYYQKTEVDNMVRWRPPVTNEASLPPYTENLDGDVIMTLDTRTIWRFDYYGAPQGVWVPIVGAQLYWAAPIATYADLPSSGNVVGSVRLVEATNTTYWWTGSTWELITGITDHNHDDLYYRKSEIAWRLPANTYSLLPTTGNTVGEVRITLDTNNIYRWNGNEWGLISASPLWREPVATLTDLPTSGNVDGDCRVVKDSSCLYQWVASKSKWEAVFNPDHTHDDRYYTKTQLDNGQLDSRYYTESEVDKKVFNHTHNGTDSEQIDYSDLLNVPYFYWKNPVVTVADLPASGNTVGDARIVLNDADLYTWNGALWTNVTAAQLVAHNHDDRYYTQDEIDSTIASVELWVTNQLALKAALEHNHNDLYYTKAETTSLIDEHFDVDTGHDHDGTNSKRISYYSLIDIPSIEAHNHDDLYYRKTELQTAGESEVNWDNVINKPDLANGHWKSPVQSKSDLPLTDNTIYDIRIVLDESEIYEWSGAEWEAVGYWENRYVDYWKPPIDTYSDLPVLNNVNGDIRLVLDENTLYRWNQDLGEWIVVFSSTYNLQVYLNGDLLMEDVEYVRIKEQSIKLKFEIESGCRLTIVITGEVYTRCDFVSYSGQKLFEINNRYKRFDWTANAGHTIFTMTSSYTVGAKQLLVWLNGDLLRVGDDYTERSTMSFQMSYPLNSEDKVTAVILDQSSGDGEYIREDVYATSGQTQFVLTNPFEKGSKRLLIYYNGMLLKVTDDYTEDNSTTVTLVNRKANANDHLTFIYFGNTSGLGDTTGADILLGVSSDETYQDGLLDLVSTMKMNDAIDDINEALLDLAPDPAATLTNQSLTSTGLNLYSGYVSADNLYFETKAGAYCTYLTENSTFSLFTPEACFGDADKGTIQLYLNGTKIDEFSLYKAFVVANEDSAQTAITYGLQASGARENEGTQGSNGAIRDSSTGLISVLSVQKYNNFKMWQQGKVRINITSSYLRQGYNYIYIKHSMDDSIETSNTLKLFLDNSNTRPILEKSIALVEENLVSSKYVSGIRYYSISDSFRVGISAYRIFSNTFAQVPMKLSMPGMSEIDVEYNNENVSGPQTPPRLGDFFDYNGVLTLNEFNDYSINGQLYVQTFDPFGAGDAVYSSDSNILINTYTNGSTDLIEYFRDEIYRLPSGEYNTVPTARSNLWDNKSVLTNGNAMLYNCSLKYPNINFTSYRPAQTANYSSFTGQQTYYRAFYKRTSKNSGDITIKGITLPEVLTSTILIDIKLPTQTGWLSLNKNYDVSTFTGADGDGCLLKYADGVFTYSSGTFSTANSGYTVVIRITLLTASTPIITYMEMGW